MNTNITKQQKQQFQEQGYIVLEKVLSPERLERIKAQTKEKIDQREGRVQDWLKAGYMTLWGVFSEHIGLNDLGGEIATLRCEPRALETVAALLDSPVEPFLTTSMQVMYPNCGCKQPWHQDHVAGDPELWWVNWIYYLDDMTEKNGALMVLPGSHREPLEQRMPDYELVPGAVRVTCPAGSAVVAYQSLLHAAEENRSDMLRRSILTRFAPFGLKTDKMHDQRYSRGRRYGNGPIHDKVNPDGSYWFPS